MTTFTLNQNLASVCLVNRIIPAIDASVLVVSICVALLRVITLLA